METRANYVLIGAFALAGFLGILGFFLWFANVQLDRQFAYYDIDFTTVSGLTDASDVRFAGLPVGQVVDVGLSPLDDGRVRVRIEVDAATPVRVDSVATIEAQGVTGVSFVGITAGTPQAPLLAAISTDEVPEIRAGQSILQSLSEDAPEILEDTLEVVRDLRDLFGEENRDRIETILENVESSSASFSQALEDFSAVSGTVSSFVEQIDQFNTTLDTLTGDASGVIEAAETTLASIDALSEDAGRVLARASDALEQTEETMATADTYVTSELQPATVQLRSSVAEIENRFVALSEDADDLIATFAETGETATARLNEAQKTLTAANDLVAGFSTTLTTVEAAATRLDRFIDESADPLFADLDRATAEATSVIQIIGETAEADLPVILSEIRTAAEATSAAVSAVGDNLTSATGRLDGLAENAGETLDSARVTFENANETLAAINSALETGDRALSAAERTFAGADRVLNEDISQITEELRTAIGSLETAVAAVAEDIPGVTEDLRAASRSAEAAFAEIEDAVDDSAPALREFAATALPQYGRLAAETREMIRNLNALTEQIRSDPSRFLVGSRNPEFSR